MTGTPSGGAFSLAYFAVGHSKRHWMVLRWSLHMVIWLHWYNGRRYFDDNAHDTFNHGYRTYISILLVSPRVSMLLFSFTQVEHVTPPSYPHNRFE